MRKKYLVLLLFLERGRSYETAWYEPAVWKYLSFLMYTPDISDQSATRVKNMKTENVTVEEFIYPDMGVQKLNTLVQTVHHTFFHFMEGRKASWVDNLSHAKISCLR